MQMTENDKRGLLERNNSFAQKRDMKVSRGLPTGMKECTFRPQVLKPSVRSPKAEDIVKRLYSYMEYYDKRREACKTKLTQ